MNKSIEFTPAQIKAYENGATVFMFPIDKGRVAYLKEMYPEYAVTELLLDESPLQIGDKDIQIKQEIDCLGECNYGMPCQVCGSTGQGAGKAIAIVGTLKEILDIKIARVKDLDYEERNNISGFLLDSGNVYFTDIYNQQLKEQKINRTYNDNDYLFIIKVKR